jgi:hypothetical protein
MCDAASRAVPAVRAILNPVERQFTVAEARALLDRTRADLAEFVEHRAAFAELEWALRNDPSAASGGVAELKALEARLDATLSVFRDSGVRVKGFAPLLLDFPSVRDGRAVLLCWLEGDETLAWYHPVELGFPGRRPL